MVNDTPLRPNMGTSLRAWGVLILVMFVLTSAVGGSLALESSYLAVTLVSHIGLALMTVVICAYVSLVEARRYRTRPRGAARLAGACAGVATLAGIVFLLFGPSIPALYVMEGFAVLGIIASILMIAFGGPSGELASTLSPA